MIAYATCFLFMTMSMAMLIKNDLVVNIECIWLTAVIIPRLFSKGNCRGQPCFTNKWPHQMFLFVHRETKISVIDTLRLGQYIVRNT